MLKDKASTHAEPEYPVQQQLEEEVNQSYNKMLLAQSVNVLKEVDKSLKDGDLQS